MNTLLDQVNEYCENTGITKSEFSKRVAGGKKYGKTIRQSLTPSGVKNINEKQKGLVLNYLENKTRKPININEEENNRKFLAVKAIMEYDKISLDQRLDIIKAIIL